MPLEAEAATQGHVGNHRGQAGGKEHGEARAGPLWFSQEGVGEQGRQAKQTGLASLNN